MAVYALLLALASMEWLGYAFGDGNHSLQVPILKHYANPSLYRMDPLLDSVGGYATFFFPALAVLLRAVGHLEGLYFALFLVGQFVSLLALAALARVFFNDDRISAAVCFLYLARLQSLGAEFNYWERLTHAHVAGALLLVCLYLHFVGRPASAMALAGLTFNLHALYAAHLVAVLVGMRVLRRRVAWRPLLRDGLLFLILASPCLFWMLSHRDTVSPEALGPWLTMLRGRSGLHSFPASVPAAVYGRYALLMALMAIGIWSAPKDERRADVLRAGVVVALMAAAAYAFSEWYPQPTILRAQLLRSTRWLTMLGSLYLGHLLVTSWTWGTAARGAVISVWLGVSLLQPGFLALALVLYLLRPRDTWRSTLAIAGGAALVLAASAGAVSFPERLGLQPAYTLARAALANPVVGACLGLLFAIRVRGFPAGRRALSVVAGTIVVLAFVSACRMNVERAPDAWVSVQLWTRAQTPPEAILLTPPYREGFRVFSERAIVGEWKDGTQQYFSWAFASGWRDRMNDLQGESRGYDDWNDDRLIGTARRYGAEYAVVAAEAAVTLPRLYVNEEFAVCAIPRTR